MRRAAKVDATQSDIAHALMRCGVTVQYLHTVGKGCPDLLCGYRGVNFLVECKDGSKPQSKQRLTGDQETWFKDWKGQKPFVVRSAAHVPILLEELTA